MRKTSGGPFFKETHAATNLAPTLVTQGSVLKLAGGDTDPHNADAIELVCKFTGTGTVASVTPYLWYGSDSAGAWVSGTLYAVKKVGDEDGGAILDIPGSGAARRLYVHVSVLDADGVVIEGYHNEHSEVL
jgi:hypothetical protein